MSSQGIGLVDVLQILLCEEVISQLLHMRQALQSRVHKASISEVPQASKPSLRLRSVLQLFFFLIRLSLVGASILMMTLISCLAMLGAINSILAATDKVQLIFFLAVIAGSL